jgi:hypothetical protein
VKVRSSGRGRDGRWLRALRVWSTCGVTWRVVTADGALLASSAEPVEVRWAGEAEEEVVGVEWGPVRNCAIYIETPDKPLGDAPGTSPISTDHPPPLSSYRIVVEYTGEAAVRRVLEHGERGFWSIGLMYESGLYEINVASLSQPVSIPVTFYVAGKVRDKPVCVKVRGGVLDIRGVQPDKFGYFEYYPPPRVYTSGGEVFNLGVANRKFDPGVPITDIKAQAGIIMLLGTYVLEGVITVTPARLGLEEPQPEEGALNALFLTWVDCETGRALSHEAPVVVRVRASGNQLPPPQDIVAVVVKPASGVFSPGEFPGNIFPVTVTASREVELSFALGVGLTEEDARRNAVEIELIDRGGNRHRKIRARDLKILFKLPPRLYTPVYVYLEPRVNGVPKSARMWKFFTPHVIAMPITSGG